MPGSSTVHVLGTPKGVPPPRKPSNLKFTYRRQDFTVDWYAVFDMHTYVILVGNP